MMLFGRHATRRAIFFATVASVFPGALYGRTVVLEDYARQIEADWLRQHELRFAPSPGDAAVPEVDAAGGVDGHIDGKWGFHTQNEKDPWWQVDLGTVTEIERIVLFNRCDGEMGRRNDRIVVSLSDDGKAFREFYRHDGTPFLGHADGKPLVVPAAGAKARYVRLGLEGTSYFHLDEVEVYAKESGENIAIGKSATQSSTSQWSSPPRRSAAVEAEFHVAEVIDRGLRLAEDLKQRGVDVAEAVETLTSVKASGTNDQVAYLKAQWAIRSIAISNPLLDFDEILFVKRQPTMYPHVSDQYYGWWARPGGGIFILSGFKQGRPSLRCLTEDFPEGNFVRPELSYDGTKVLFAFARYYPEVCHVADKTRCEENLPEDSFYHLFEMNTDGSGLRQLTHGYYNDFDGRYLPDGRIIFLSTRKGTALQAGLASAQRTLEATQPESFVRCGGGNERPVAVYTLHRMNADGSDLCAISAFENFEWTPSIAHDGRILYARWDYIDRFNGHFMSLWSTNPDGTYPNLVYGNYTKRPQCVFEARPIPHSRKLIFTATAHHSITGGSLALLDRSLGSEFEHPLTRLTPEVCFPETEGFPSHYYSGPWPLDETHYLCAWHDRELPPHRCMTGKEPENPGNAGGIYLYDAFGNLNLLYRDPEITSQNPIPLCRRPMPAALPEMVDWTEPQQGRFLLQDVARGMGTLGGGEVRRIRVVGVLPKVQPQMNTPVLSVSGEDTGKVVLGTVPVRADGSAWFEIPSGFPVFFQALDADGVSLRTMRSLTYVQPGRTIGCVGCHESRDSAPVDGRFPMALAGEPDALRPDPEGSWPLRYDRLVQPVLDRYCIDCHSPGAEAAKRAEPNLTPSASYDSLINFADRDLYHRAFERDESLPGVGVARGSRLYTLLTEGEGHAGVTLDAESLYRLAVWMDTYAHRQGAFSAEQEAELEEFRKQTQ